MCMKMIDMTAYQGSKKQKSEPMCKSVFSSLWFLRTSVESLSFLGII